MQKCVRVRKIESDLQQCHQGVAFNALNSHSPLGSIRPTNEKEERKKKTHT